MQRAVSDHLSGPVVHGQCPTDSQLHTLVRLQTSLASQRLSAGRTTALRNRCRGLLNVEPIDAGRSGGSVPYGHVVIVPSTATLSELFGTEPVSVAETSVGHVLPLERWPEGEVRIDSEKAGRRVEVYFRPLDGRVTINVFSPDLIASLNLRDVVAVAAVNKPHGVRAMTVKLDGDTVTLRLRPEISVHYGNLHS